MPGRIEALVRAALLASLAMAAPLALACGYCIEDRVAAVYDHDVVEAAVAKKRFVAFFSIAGAGTPDAASRRAIATALEAGGVLKGTTRVALESAACSAAFDPARTSLERIVAKANQPLAAKGLSIAALRVIDAGGKLRAP